MISELTSGPRNAVNLSGLSHAVAGQEILSDFLLSLLAVVGREVLSDFLLFFLLSPAFAFVGQAVSSDF